MRPSLDRMSTRCIRLKTSGRGWWMVIRTAVPVWVRDASMSTTLAALVLSKPVQASSSKLLAGCTSLKAFKSCRCCRRWHKHGQSQL